MSPDQNYSVVITGASRGIGRRIAMAFARETDFALLLISRTDSDLSETKALCEAADDNNIHTVACDLTDPEAAGKISLPDDFPSPKIIVNNAGGFLLKPLQETSHGEFVQQLQSNLLSAVNVTNRFLSDQKANPTH